MLEFMTQNGGILFALLGAVLAAGLAGMGSAKAVEENAYENEAKRKHPRVPEGTVADAGAAFRGSGRDGGRRLQVGVRPVRTGPEADHGDGGLFRRFRGRPAGLRDEGQPA